MPKSKNRRLRSRTDAKAKGKKIRAPETPELDHNNRCPDYCFHHTVKGYTVADCDEPAQIALINGLWERSRLTWREIMLAPRTGLGKEKINRDSLTVKPPASITKDVNFIAFRIGDVGRIVGFRDDSVLHIVWIDPLGKTYPH